jgi:hypothetical protein
VPAPSIVTQQRRSARDQRQQQRQVLAVLDLDVKSGKVADFATNSPSSPNLLPADRS